MSTVHTLYKYYGHFAMITSYMRFCNYHGCTLQKLVVWNSREQGLGRKMWEVEKMMYKESCCIGKDVVISGAAPSGEKGNHYHDHQILIRQQV